MKKTLIALGIFGLAALVFAYPQRQISSTITVDSVYQVNACSDITTPYPGQMCVDYGSASAPAYIYLWDPQEEEWDQVPVLDEAASYTSTVTLGDDEEDAITANGALTLNVWREDFDNAGGLFMENDGTPAVVTDASVNLIHVRSPSGNIPVIGYRIEAPGGPGLAATPAPFGTYGVLTLDGFTDDADNEGLAITFGAQDNATDADGFSGRGIVFDETNTSGSMYCEAQIDIADISDTDDLWFGWVLNDATDNPPASADFDTYAGFTLLDNTGDLYINTALNNAAEGADDTAVDWTDGDQFVLRVIISADSVEFEAALTDGGTTLSAITQTNATLNADDGDVFKCQLGYTNAAAGDPTVTVNYVEIGVEQ